jgi:hypothetical protein
MHIDDFASLDPGRASWLFDGHEFEVSSVSVYRDDSCYANFLILYTSGSEPFGVSQPSGGRDEACYWKDRYVSLAEFSNGYAEIDGDIHALEDPSPEPRLRYLARRALLIAPHASSAMQSKSQQSVVAMLESVEKANGSIGAEDLRNFASAFRHNIDSDVSILR